MYQPSFLENFILYWTFTLNYINFKIFIAGCAGRLENFFYNTSDFFETVEIKSRRFNLPSRHPLRVCTLIVFCLNMIISPVLYFIIFKHINIHNENFVGLSQKAKSERKRRNLVNIKFNLLAWILEGVSLTCSLISPTYDIVFLFIMNISPPLIYFYGIEENRRSAEEYFKSRMRIFKRKKNVEDASQDKQDWVKLKEAAVVSSRQYFKLDKFPTITTVAMGVKRQLTPRASLQKSSTLSFK